MWKHWRRHRKTMPFNGIKNKKHPQTYSINQTKCALHPFNNKNGIRISRKGRWKEKNLKPLPCGHNFTKMISIHDDLRGMIIIIYVYNRIYTARPSLIFSSTYNQHAGFYGDDTVRLDLALESFFTCLHHSVSLDGPFFLDVFAKIVAHSKNYTVSFRRSGLGKPLILSY